MKIYPHKICGENIPFRDAGKVIRELLMQHWENEDYFDIIFEGKPVNSISFFDEAIAVLLETGISVEELKKKLNFPDIQENDRLLLNFALKKKMQGP